MRRIAFDKEPLLEPAEGVRCQTVLRGGHQLRIVEFTPGFRETEWCNKAHLGYILTGQMEIEFSDSVEVFTAGDALIIEGGDKHRARVVDGPVRIFLVEDT